MKKAIRILVLLFFIVLINCDEDKVIDYQFEATVLGQGIDCGETYLINLTNISGITEITGGTYYADNLPSDLKIIGINIVLNCRLPNDEEVYACTDMGPSYPHVFVINGKEVY